MKEIASDLCVIVVNRSLAAGSTVNNLNKELVENTVVTIPKESIDICVARKKELIKTLIVCGVNSVKYNWEKEIQIHSNEGCVMVDGKTMDVRVQQLNDWYRGSSYFGVINIESLRNEKIQDALYLGIKDGYIGSPLAEYRQDTHRQR